MRMWSVLAGVTLAWGVVSTAAAENGLERFEREIKPQITLDKFTYGKAEPLGDAGFVLTDVVAVIPKNDGAGSPASTLKIEKVTVEALDFDRLKDSDGDSLPRFANIKLQGMTGDEAMTQLLTPYGIPAKPADITFDYRLDVDKKVLTLNKLEVSLRDLSRLSLSLVMDGISDKASEMEGAKDDGRLRTAALTLEDNGLAAKLLTAIAQQQGGSPDSMVALALLSIASFSAGQGPETQASLDAVASFVGDWQAPKGPLVITLKPTKTASMADLNRFMEPNALKDIFGFGATYPGTRAGAATAGPAAK
ncbi:MAG TPA: hypothetical protein VMI56_27670 [Reyranella sp.]|nr:hypothetical protein [Reyranella sp.]